MKIKSRCGHTKPEMLCAHCIEALQWAERAAKKAAEEIKKKQKMKQKIDEDLAKAGWNK